MGSPTLSTMHIDRCAEQWWGRHASGFARRCAIGLL